MTRNNKTQRGLRASGYQASFHTRHFRVSFLCTHCSPTHPHSWERPMLHPIPVKEAAAKAAAAKAKEGKGGGGVRRRRIKAAAAAKAADKEAAAKEAEVTSL